MKLFTVDIPYGNAGSAESPHGFSNTNSYIEIGWDDTWLPNPYYCNSWFQFDVSLMPNIPIRYVQSAILRINKAGDASNGSSYALTSAIHQILRPLFSPNNPTWSKYDGVNNWAIAGGTGNGTDRVATPLFVLNNSTPVVNGFYEFPLSLEFLNTILTGNLNFGIYTTSPKPPSGSPYGPDRRTISKNNFYIHITYRKPSLSGDVTIF